MTPADLAEAPPRAVPAAAVRAWPSELAHRARWHLPLKLAGVTAFTWLFFLAYFQLLRHPAYPVTVMPLTALDRLIPFQPVALGAYLSLWIYVGIAPGLMLSLRALIGYGAWTAAMCLAGLTCFYFWPTEVPALAFDVFGFPGFSMLQGVDAAGNACPSMHVAAAMFSAIWIDHVLREARVPIAPRLINALWFAAIAYSTLAVRQHVALDALAGMLLGVAFAWPSLRWRLEGRHQPGAAI